MILIEILMMLWELLADGDLWGFLELIEKICGGG